LAYERYDNAGEVPFAEWRKSGILIPVFDKDGTLTDANSLTLVEEVMDGLEQQGLAGIYPEIALASNNHDHGHVEEAADLVRTRLDIGVFAISRAQGYKSKPSGDMGFVIANHFEVQPKELGVIGDRRLTDVSFGRSFGAGAIALCDKAGEGDAPWVPQLRVIEAGIVAIDTIRGIAVRP